MRIVIVGDGKIGSALAEQLSREGHEITIVDRSGAPLRSTMVISCPSRESCSASALPIFPSPTITIRMVSTPFSLIRSEFVTNIVPRRPLFCNQPPVKPLFRNVPSCPMREKAVY